MNSAAERGRSRFPAPDISPPCEGYALYSGRYTRNERFHAIYDKDGTALPNSDIVSTRFNSIPESAPDLGQEFDPIKGPVLFAGLAAEQFGFTLTNALGRLWALDQLPKDTILYYLPQKRGRHRTHPYLLPVLEALGIKNRVLLGFRPLKFDALHLAPDLFGDRYDGHGARHFFNWLDRRWWPSGPVKLGTSIYVSRSKLGPKAGRYACEDHLEQLLADAGYEIFHPEEHDIHRQVAKLQEAERLVFAESSALHLYAMIRRPEQTAAVIQRRRDLPPLIDTQLEARPGLPVQRINAIKSEYWPPVRRDNTSVSLLDFSYLREVLVSGGLLSERAAWSAPTARDEATSLSAALEPGESLLDLEDREVFMADQRLARQA